LKWTKSNVSACEIIAADFHISNPQIFKNGDWLLIMSYSYVFVKGLEFHLNTRRIESHLRSIFTANYKTKISSVTVFAVA